MLQGIDPIDAMFAADDFGQLKEGSWGAPSMPEAMLLVASLAGALAPCCERLGRRFDRLLDDLWTEIDFDDMHRKMTAEERKKLIGALQAMGVFEAFAFMWFEEMGMPPLVQAD